MSLFVELPPDLYDPLAFAGFEQRSDFTVRNARALMWYSQLAYETGQPATIEHVRKLWDFDRITPLALQVSSPTGHLDTRAVIGTRKNALVIAFGGTDPAIWENLWTDLNVRPSRLGTHSGFQTAFDAVTEDIDQAITENPREYLFFAGHSLGAALAVLAARRALERGNEPSAVYTFGMPRLGQREFVEKYNRSKLGMKTYRLVHGMDVVARVPLSKFGYRHVGRVLQCKSGEKFAPTATLSELGSDAPLFAANLRDTIAGGLLRLTTGQVFSSKGPGPIGPLLKFLPIQLRDHLPDQYYGALS